MKRLFDYQTEYSGLTNRLAQMFNRQSGHTVLLAVDHGYFQGAPQGLINLGKTIAPLLPYCDALSPTIGGLKTSIDPWTKTPIILRATGGSSMRKAEELDNEVQTVSIKEIVKLNAIGFTVSCFIGLPHQKDTLETFTRMTYEGHKYGLISIGITAVGADPHLTKFVRGEREDGGKLTVEDKKEAVKYLKHACRVVSENGADIVKTYYCEGFEEVVDACLAPIVIAGGTKRPTLEALQFTHKAIQAGAVGVDMGRNIFQNEHPVAMINAIRAIVHEGQSPQEALQLYQQIQQRQD